MIPPDRSAPPPVPRPVPPGPVPLPVAGDGVEDEVDPQLVDDYRQHVSGLYDMLAKHHARQMAWYRGARILVILSAGSIPVLTGIPAVPGWVVAILGAVAAATEALVQLFRWRDSAITSMRSANVIEDHLTRFDLRLPPYDGPPGPAFRRFADAVLVTSSAVSRDFLGLWAEDLPSGGAGPTAPGA